jgi:hypothetical protein
LVYKLVHAIHKAKLNVCWIIAKLIAVNTWWVRTTQLRLMRSLR